MTLDMIGGQWTCDRCLVTTPPEWHPNRLTDRRRVCDACLEALSSEFWQDRAETELRKLGVLWTTEGLIGPGPAISAVRNVTD